MDILLEIGDTLLDNAKKFFFKFSDFNYNIIPTKDKDEFLNIEATKNYNTLYSFDQKIELTVKSLIKSSLEYYKAAFEICNERETQKDIIVQFEVVIANVRYMLSFIGKTKYQHNYLTLINEYEQELDNFKIKNNFLAIKSAPSLTSHRIKTDKK